MDAVLRPARFAYLRQNLSGFNSPDPALQGYVGASYSNAQQSNFLGNNRDNFLFRAMPSVGLEYRYPFFAQTPQGTHHVEPIAQSSCCVRTRRRSATCRTRMRRA